MTLMAITVGCVAFFMGWIISKVINTPKIYEEGRLAVYHSKTGVKLVKLVQPAYAGQAYVYVDIVDGDDTKGIPFFIAFDKLRMFTIDGEVINEANWNDVD
jgi:hypothetical protein